MAKDALSNERAVAESAAQHLATVPGVIGVCLYGSVARGTADPASDIDVLVLVDQNGETSQLRPSSLISGLPDPLRDQGVVLSCYTPATLVTYLRRWSRFGAHLRQESVILHDPTGTLERILTTDVPVSIDYELREQRNQLADFERIERFGGRLLFPLAHIYGIGRTTVFALLAQRGQLEFDRTEAFQELTRLEPGLAGEIATVSGLAPFYDQVRNPSVTRPLPFDPAGQEAESRFAQARAAVAQLLTPHRQAS